MPSTHTSLHYHAVFSTKNRVALIPPSWRSRLHSYLAGILKNLDAVPEAIGGTGDHIHLLFGLRPTHCLANVIRDVKSNSSRWMHDEMHDNSAEWQDGYGAFTVGAPQCSDVRDYILCQEEHHKKRTFQEEYLDFLRRGLVEFDERYLW